MRVGGGKNTPHSLSQSIKFSTWFSMSLIKMKVRIRNAVWTRRNKIPMQNTKILRLQHFKGPKYAMVLIVELSQFSNPLPPFSAQWPRMYIKFNTEGLSPYATFGTIIKYFSRSWEPNGSNGRLTLTRHFWPTYIKTKPWHISGLWNAAVWEFLCSALEFYFFWSKLHS